MKTVMIIGGSSGLGLELALGYGNRGYRVIIGGRDEVKLRDGMTRLKNNNIQCMSRALDVTDYGSITNTRQWLIDSDIEIDVLVNSAGVGYFAPIKDITQHEIEKMLDVNLKGTIFTTKILMDRVKERILNIISTAGLRGKVNEAVYCASKFGVRGFTEGLQKEYEESNLCFTSVYMGGMDTPFWDDSTHIKDKSRLKSPEEVAKEIIEMDDGRKEIII